MSGPYYADDLVTLYLGDCREITDWLEADVLVTDPPYGTESVGWDVSYGRGKNRRHGRTDMPPGVIANDATSLARDGALALWGADKPALIFGSPRRAEPPGEWTHRLVWDKREPGLGVGPWRYNHELIFVRGEGWTRVSPKSFSVISVASGNGTPEKRDHVHAKPLQLMRLLVAAAPAGLLADPFAGSGSTVVAAKQFGRRCIAVEYEERYCEVTAKRLAQDVLDFGGVA